MPSKGSGLGGVREKRVGGSIERALRQSIYVDRIEPELYRLNMEIDEVRCLYYVLVLC